MFSPKFGPQPHDKRAAGLEQIHFSENPVSSNNTRSSQDPWQTQGASNHGLHVGGLILHGRVVDSIAHARSYKVQCDRGVGVIQCCDSGQASFGLLGARPLATYPIGSQVLVYYYPQSIFAIILCAVPDWFYDPRHKLADTLVQGSNVGLYHDLVHRTPVQLPGGGIADFSANRPTDSLQLGEWGAITETGSRVFLDSFMAQIGIDEITSVTAFYVDQLLRLAGHNLQIWSAGHTFESVDDEGEASAIESYSPYIWETSGVIDPTETPSVERAADGVSGTRSRVEPVHDDLLPVHRDVTYRGYLGQGGKRVVQAPTYGSTYSRLSDEGTTVKGFLDETRGLDGSYGIRSAHSVIIAKSPAIPVPRRIKRAEDPAGDSAEQENYLSCGQFGEASLDPHAVVGTLPNTNSDRASAEIASIFDYVSYLFNWKGLHAFYYHSLDWYLADETDLIGVPVLAFSALNTQHFMADPPSITSKVDDRYGLTEYFNSRAHIAITPQGGISIVDAWGSELRMASGHIELHSAGDNVRTAGRSIVDRAGWDGIYLANNCLDLVSNRNNVSIKGESNVMITGGNDRCGGVLIQSLSDDPAFETSTGGQPTVGGVIIRAKKSMVSILSKEVFVATNAWGDADAGRIVLNCGNHPDSNGSVIIRGYQIISQAKSCIVDIIGTDSERTINEYWKEYSLVSNKLVVKKQAYLWDCVTVHGNLGVTGFVVCPLDEVTHVETTNNAITTRDILTDTDAVIAESVFPFTETDIEDVEFSFRNSDVMKTEDYVAYEAAWQQLFRLGNDPSIIDVWQEQTYTDDQGNDSRAYPGFDVWAATDRYGLVSLTMFDPFIMASINRDDPAYAIPEVAPITYVSLDNNWPVIRNPL